MDEMSELSELLRKQEELHPDLQDYIFEVGSLGPCLQHPLIYNVPHVDAMNALINKRYGYIKEAVEKAKAEGNWARYVFQHEKPYRFHAFTDIMFQLSDAEYWEMFAELWTNSENIWQVPAGALLQARDNPHLMMNEEEKHFYDSLPNQIVIYRGFAQPKDYPGIKLDADKCKYGYSWTLSHWHASWFAYRFAGLHKNPRVAKAVVQKNCVKGVLLGRGEWEVIVNPHEIEITTLRKLPHSGELKLALNHALNAFELQKSSYHGPRHWDKVERNVMEISKWMVPKPDLKVCRLFAILHDCRRQDENDDPAHGHRAADFMVRIQDDLRLTEKQLDQLYSALTHHNSGQTSTDPTIGTCWDADRLELIRVGIVPDLKYFSTKVAKELIWQL